MYRKIPIEELERFYIINSNGNIVEKSTGKSLCFNKNTYGYYQHYFKELKASLLIHRIIIAKYLPNSKEEFLVVNHKDLCKTNNNINNLEWTTIKDNIIHSVSNQVYNKPNNIRVLSDYEVVDIYKDLLNGSSNKDVTEKYNISLSTVRNIKYKRTNKDILKDLPDINKKTSRNSLDDNTKNNIINDIKNNIKPSDISKKYNVNVQMVRDIKCGKIFKNFNLENVEKLKGGEKLKKEDVLQIINLYKSGTSIKEISEKYGVSNKTIQNILRKKTWKDLTKDIEIIYE